MKKQITSLLLTILVGFAFAGVAAESSLDEDREQLQKIGAEYLKAFNAGDAKTVATFFAEDAVMVSWDGVPVKGREAIGNRMKEVFAANPKLKMASTAEEFRLIPSEGLVVFGSVSNTGNSPEWPTNGKFLTVWQKIEGQWKLVTDLGFVPYPR